jgi:hypothetical protein
MLTKYCTPILRCSTHLPWCWVQQMTSINEVSSINIHNSRKCHTQHDHYRICSCNLKWSAYAVHKLHNRPLDHTVKTVWFSAIRRDHWQSYECCSQVSSGCVWQKVPWAKAAVVHLIIYCFKAGGKFFITWLVAQQLLCTNNYYLHVTCITM